MFGTMWYKAFCSTLANWWTDVVGGLSLFSALATTEMVEYPMVINNNLHILTVLRKHDLEEYTATIMLVLIIKSTPHNVGIFS